MCICPDLDEVSKVIYIFFDGKSPGVHGLHPEVIKRGGRKRIELLNTVIDDTWEILEILQTEPPLFIILRQTDIRDCSNYRGILLVSMSGKKFTLIQSNDTSRGFSTWGTMWVSYKPMNLDHELPVTKTGEMCRTEFVLVHIYQSLKSLRHLIGKHYETT